MRHYAPRVQAMDAYNVKRLPQERAVIFVASTTGQVSKDDLYQSEQPRSAFACHCTFIGSYSRSSHYIMHAG